MCYFKLLINESVILSYVCLCVIFDSYISYLPLAHIYERANQVMMAYYGVAVGFYQGVLTVLHPHMYA